MKVAFVANSAWYLSNFRSSTLIAFVDKGSVVCLFPAPDDPQMLEQHDVCLAPFYLEASSTQPVKEIRSLLSLVIKLFRVRPDIVFSFNPKTNLYSMVACWLLRLPCIPNVSGVGVASQLSGLKGTLYRHLAKFFYRRARYVFFQNLQDRENFLRAGWVAESKSEVVPGSGVDLARYCPTKRESVSPVRFLMAARLLKAKGVLEFLQASRELQALKPGQVEFILAGNIDDSERGVPEGDIEAWNQCPGMSYFGHVSDMPALLDTIDCVVLPSYYPEGVPRSLIEGAAAGKVIITTDMPGCRDVVRTGENGYLVEPKSIKQLADAMLKVANLADNERQRMQFASRALAEEKFDEKIVIRSYLQVFERLTSSFCDSAKF